MWTPYINTDSDLKWFPLLGARRSNRNSDCDFMVGLERIALPTFPMSREHSTNELKARDPCFNKQKYNLKNLEKTHFFVF